MGLSEIYYYIYRSSFIVFALPAKGNYSSVTIQLFDSS